MLIVKISNNEDTNVGLPLIADNSLVECPKCKSGHLFTRYGSELIECTYQPSCDYNILLDYYI